MADLDIYQGGRKCPDIGTDLLGSSAIGPDVQIRDMGPDTAHEEGFGRIPPQGGLQADVAATKERLVRRMVLPSVVGWDGVGRFVGGGDLCLPLPEHSSAIYCN